MKYNKKLIAGMAKAISYIPNPDDYNTALNMLCSPFAQKLLELSKHNPTIPEEMAPSTKGVEKQIQSDIILNLQCLIKIAK